jgi:broad-specificity NMP kinase
MTPRLQQPRRPRLVELAGPAGVGKSTLSDALCRRYRADQGTIWGLPRLPLLANGVQLVPTLFGLWLHSRSVLWDESRHLVRLQTLQRHLYQNPKSGRLLIFDEGPVFALAWLRGFGHVSMRSNVADVWWQQILHQWSMNLDAVVVLDAHDSVLAQRIRIRPEWHEIKHASDPEISVWMERFRAALDWVLAGLTRDRGPVIVRIRIDQDAPDRIAERVIAALSQVNRDN